MLTSGPRVVLGVVAQAANSKDALVGVIAHGADALDHCETGRGLAVCVLDP